MEHFDQSQKKVETLIYGGAFNPPTLAHRAILQACIDYAEPRNAHVWIMPSGERTDKHIGVSTARRLALINAMIADTDTGSVETGIVTNELERTIAVETFDTVLELNEAHPEREFTWVFGADSTETMAEWQNGEWLLENLSMLLIDRQGSHSNPLAQHAMALTVPSLAVSSTMVRQRLAAHLPVDDLVSPRVAALLA